MNTNNTVSEEIWLLQKQLKNVINNINFGGSISNRNITKALNGIFIKMGDIAYNVEDLEEDIAFNEEQRQKRR